MNQKVLTIPLRKINILYILFIAVIMLLFSYGTIAINTILLTSSAQSFNEKINKLDSKLIELNSRYIDVTSAINIDMAYKMGLVENLKNTVFITRTNTVAAFLSK